MIAFWYGTILYFLTIIITVQCYLFLFFSFQDYLSNGQRLQLSVTSNKLEVWRIPYWCLKTSKWKIQSDDYRQSGKSLHERMTNYTYHWCLLQGDYCDYVGMLADLDYLLEEIILYSLQYHWVAPFAALKVLCIAAWRNNWV